MENKFDPQRSMIWYHIFKVLMIVGIPITMLLLYSGISTSGLTVDEFFEFLPAYSVITTLYFMGDFIFRIFLFVNLLEYSPRAPKICLMMIGFTFTYCALLAIFSVSYDAAVQEVILQGALTSAVSSFIYFYLNFIYLRKRLVKLYWKKPASMQANPSTQSMDSSRYDYEQFYQKQSQVIPHTTDPEEQQLTENEAQAHSAADEISKLKNLLDSNALTQEEYDTMKKQLLNI